ncbi:MAG: DHH family phosphoesterase [Silvanigrellaceae bacterium]|nr:DHH family phosphoesterase [Silvanigrellaceae bacterium]
MDSSIGLLLVISDDLELASTLAHIKPKNMEVKVWLPNKQNALQQALLEACEEAEDDELLVKGEVTKSSFFSQWKSFEPICVILSLKDDEKYETVRSLVFQELPEAKMLSLQIGHPKDVPRKLAQDDRELLLSWSELLQRPISAELRHIETTHRVKAVKDILDSGDKIAFLLQPDPDPDGLAAALALRAVLGRNKVSTPIVTFGKVTRPENLAMMRMLDIDVTTIKPEELSEYDRVVLLDTQPSHFSCILPRVDVIIDHHPMVGNYAEIPYSDIRPKYGATSSIMVEYLRASATNIGQRLATALLYGVKSDTLFLNREVIDADLDAFVLLYPKINYNLLRRIEKPELPMRFAPILADALRNMECENRILVSCLGEVEREDLIPQIADFLLQFEDVDWVVCVGIFEKNIVMSIRNVGYVKNAGDVVKRIVQGWGFGGGHRTMAKAIIPVAHWTERYGKPTFENLRTNVLKVFGEEVV